MRQEIGRGFFLLVLSFVFCSEAYLADNAIASVRIAVVSIEQINMQAKEYVPATEPLKDRLEQSLKDTGIFNVVSGELEKFSTTAFPDSKFTDFSLRLFVSGFSDRVEFDLWAYSSFDKPRYNPKPFVAVHSFKVTVKDVSGILDAMDSFGSEVARTLQPKEAYQSRQVIFVEPFKSDEEAVKKPIQVMFCSELLSTGKFVLLDADSLKYKYNDQNYWMYDFARAKLDTKRRICKEYYDLQWYITGRIDPVGNNFRITTSGECPLRHIEKIKTSVPLGTRPEDIRLSSNDAARSLLIALGKSSKSSPIIFDEVMNADPYDEPTIKQIGLRRQNGNVLNVDVVLFVKKMESVQTRTWQWGGDPISSAPFGYVMLRVDGREVARLPIDHKLLYGSYAKKVTILRASQYDLKLTISDIFCKVSRVDLGTFGVNQRGYLNHLNARIVLERE